MFSSYPKYILLLMRIKKAPPVYWRSQYGEGGIRTRGTGYYPYDGLANRCLQPLGHLSKSVPIILGSDALCKQIKPCFLPQTTTITSDKPVCVFS
jgi:hypothetical protein